MALTPGRTVTKWIRFVVDDYLGAPREIPIDSLGPVGWTYDETEVTAWQDACKSYLVNHPDVSIDITGPLDMTGLTALAASGAAPTLSGSWTVLAPISAPTFTTPLGLWIGFGMRNYWTAAQDQAWGIVAPSSISGYQCSKFVIEGEKYSARFILYPGSVPAWGTAIIT